MTIDEAERIIQSLRLQCDAQQRDQAAWQQAIRALVEQWRRNAEMLAEGNKGEWPDPSVGMQRACADQLSALIATSLSGTKDDQSRVDREC